MKKRYERGWNQSFFVVESDFTKNANSFERKMLEQNRIEGLLPVEIKNKDKEMVYQFNITSLKSLSAMLELKKLNVDDLKNMIVEFHKLIYVLPEYLLDEENVMIDSDYIFVNPKDGTFHFCYLLEEGRNSREQFRELLSKFLSYINHDDHDAVVLGYQLLKISQGEEFVYSDLLDTVNQYIPNKHTQNSSNLQKEKTDDLQEMLQESEHLFENEENMDFTFEAAFNKSTEKEESEKKKTFSLRDFLKFKPRKVIKEQEKEELVSVSEEEKQWIEYLNEYDERKEDEEAEHTILLSERLKELETKEFHILKSMNRNVKDIELSFFPFVIGKQERVCDYVIHSNNISRIHLRLDCMDGKYYVRDLNSLNGTKLRGEVLQADRQEQIFENDDLDIAGFKFIFV